MTAPTDIQPDQLPATIRGYLAAHDARDTDTAPRAFTPTAVGVDDGVTHRGDRGDPRPVGVVVLR